MQLLEYLENGSHWTTGDSGLLELRLDGSMNKLNKVTGLWEPQRLVMSEAINTNGGKALLTGRFGYWAKWDELTQTVPDGAVRIYPDPDDTTKYVEIGSVNEVPLRVRQVHDKYIELYYETPDKLERHSFIISDHGFKTNIRLLEGYAGNGQFRLRLEFHGGLERRNGRDVYDGNTLVGILPDAFATDGNGDAFPVTESESAGVVTMGVSIQNPVWPINIDPTFGPYNTAIRHNVGYQNLPTAVTGSAGRTRVVFTGGATQHSAIYMDFSSTPMGTITDADWEEYYFAKNEIPDGINVYIDRVTRDNWTSIMTWNTYDGSNNWTAYPNGVDIDTTYRATTPCPSSFGWVNWDVTDLAEDIRANHGSKWNVNKSAPVSVGNKQMEFHGGFYVTDPSLRPRLTITHEPAAQSGGLMGGGFWGQETLMGGGVDI